MIADWSPAETRYHRLHIEEGTMKNALRTEGAGLTGLTAILVAFVLIRRTQISL